jgi:hypothetical protein
VSRAEDVVRARLAAAQASAAKAEAERLRTAIAELARNIQEAIPRLLRALDSRDYPDAQLVSVTTSTRGTFRTRTESVEMAAWMLFEDSNSDGSLRGYLLSDGRIHTDSTFGGMGATHGDAAPCTVQDIVTGGLEPSRILETLQRIWHGVPRGPIASGPGGLLELLGRYGVET